MEKTCFICLHKMDESTGLCTNPECVRSQPLPRPKAEKDSAEVNTKTEE